MRNYLHIIDSFLINSHWGLQQFRSKLPKSHISWASSVRINYLYRYLKCIQRSYFLYINDLYIFVNQLQNILDSEFLLRRDKQWTNFLLNHILIVFSFPLWCSICLIRSFTRLRIIQRIVLWVKTSFWICDQISEFPRLYIGTSWLPILRGPH